MFWLSEIDEDNDRVKSDVYDLPFGKASQTAKRYVEKKIRHSFTDQCGDCCEEPEKNIFSQDLFDSQDTNYDSSILERDDGFNRIIRTQLGMKCGRTAAREESIRTIDCQSKKSVLKNNKTFPSKFVSIGNGDLPHPKNLFRKKRKKQKQMCTTEPHKADLNDKTGSAVYGHIQQLKSKLAHRTPTKISIESNNTDVQSTEKQILSDQNSCVLSPNYNKSTVPFSNITEEIGMQNTSIPETRTWDEVDVSIHRRWMTDISFIEEE